VSALYDANATPEQAQAINMFTQRSDREAVASMRRDVGRREDQRSPPDEQAGARRDRRRLRRRADYDPQADAKKPPSSSR
jgi:hypothetical protein